MADGRGVFHPAGGLTPEFLLFLVDAFPLEGNLGGPGLPLHDAQTGHLEPVVGEVVFKALGVVGQFLTSGGEALFSGGAGIGRERNLFHSGFEELLPASDNRSLPVLRDLGRGPAVAGTERARPVTRLRQA